MVRVVAAASSRRASLDQAPARSWAGLQVSAGLPAELLEAQLALEAAAKVGRSPERVAVAQVAVTQVAVVRVAAAQGAKRAVCPRLR
jgi:hypothetical protein